MIDQIIHISQLRDDLAFLKMAKANLVAEWEASNKTLLDTITSAITTLDEAEATLRASALAEYRATGNETPGPGVEVKKFKELRYDEKEALAWAIRHEVALSLDKKVFEKVAKATPLDFVEIALVPKAFIATDLSKALEGVAEKVKS